MRKNVWIPLSPSEKRLLIDALNLRRRAKRAGSGKIEALASKLVDAKPNPPIIVKVNGGMVQCTSGNPFPIRICDYDIEGQEDPDIDERGKPCRISFEPADPKICARYGRSSRGSKI
jgi:hypothetical protein